MHVGMPLQLHVDLKGAHAHARLAWSMQHNNRRPQAVAVLRVQHVKGEPCQAGSRLSNNYIAQLGAAMLPKPSCKVSIRQAVTR